MSRRKEYYCKVCNNVIRFKVKSDNLKYCLDCADKVKQNYSQHLNLKALPLDIEDYSPAQCRFKLKMTGRQKDRVLRRLTALHRLQRPTFRTWETIGFLKMKLNQLELEHDKVRRRLYRHTYTKGPKYKYITNNGKELPKQL